MMSTYIKPCTALTPENKETIRKMYPNYSVAFIARFLGISPTTIHRFTKSQGLRKNPSFYHMRTVTGHETRQKNQSK